MDNQISVDEWDSPYQDSLWAAVRGEVDPHRGQIGGVGLVEGMRAKVAAKYPDLHPMNRSRRRS